MKPSIRAAGSKAFGGVLALFLLLACGCDQGKVYVSFGQHVDFYHSYRSDSPDETGFGHDIEVITQTLDYLEAHPRVKLSWEFDSWQSLEQRLPTYAPELYERIRRRVAEKDEVRFMSWNGGVVSAETPEEFTASIQWQRDSLVSIFGKVENGVYPQEMMHTPSLIRAYRELGVEWVSLFYSASPFTAFRNEVLLEGRELYNPLWLETPEGDARMVVVPTYHHADVADFMGLATWAAQIRSSVPGDALLFIAFDADSSTWPLLLELMLPALESLPFVEFCTPGEYLATHEPVGTIVLHRDQADGAFDGYSSWAEKPFNHEIWTAVETSRLNQDRARFLLSRFYLRLPDVDSLLAENFRWRMETLKTTHFGLATPDLHPDRVAAARNHADQIRALSGQALSLTQESCQPHLKALAGRPPTLPFPGSARAYYVYQPRSRGGLSRVRIPLSFGPGETYSGGIRVYQNRREVPSALENLETYPDGSVQRVIVVFLADLGPRAEGIYWISRCSNPRIPEPDYGQVPAGAGLDNGLVAVRFDERNWPVSFTRAGTEFASGRLVAPGITYQGENLGPQSLSTCEPEGAIRARGLFREVCLEGVYSAPCGGDVLPASVRYRLRVYGGLPGLEIDTHVSYPALEGDCRTDLTEAAPLGILPGLTAERLTVWKQNAFGYMGSYDVLEPQDSLNNHVTESWAGLSDGAKGLIVACDAERLAGLAFCPMKIRRKEDGRLLASLNPFGAYWGRQPDHDARRTGGLGLGEILTVLLGDHVKPSGPAYAGTQSSFSLLLIPYISDPPSEAERNLADAYSYPPAWIAIDPG